MAFQPLFPDLTGPGLAAGWASIDALQGTLDPAEWQDVAAAAAPRQREFVAGRLLVTALADSLSLVAKPVRRAEDRSPIWPADRRGSLSHCKELCAGVVGRPDAIQSAGIDVEALGRVQPKLWPTLFTERERHYFRSIDPAHVAIETTTFFSAKETFYKCQFPLTESWVGFQDVELERTSDTTLAVTPTTSTPRPWHGSPIHTVLLDEWHVVTLMVFPA